MKLKWIKKIFLIFICTLLLNSCFNNTVIDKLDEMMENFEELEGEKTYYLNNGDKDRQLPDYSIPWIEEKITEKDNNFYIDERLFCEYPMSMNITKINSCEYNEKIYTIGFSNKNNNETFLCSIDKNFTKYNVISEWNNDFTRFYVLYNGLYICCRVKTDTEDTPFVYNLYKLTLNDEIEKVCELNIQNPSIHFYEEIIQLSTNDHTTYNFEGCSYFLYENYLYKLSAIGLELCSDKIVMYVKNITKESFSFYYSKRSDKTLMLLNEDGTSNTILDYKFMKKSQMAENVFYLVNNMIFIFFDNSIYTNYIRSIAFDPTNEKFYKHTCELKDTGISEIHIYDDKTFYHIGSNESYYFTMS